MAGLDLESVVFLRVAGDFLGDVVGSFVVDLLERVDVDLAWLAGFVWLCDLISVFAVQRGVICLASRASLRRRLLR